MPGIDLTLKPGKIRGEESQRHAAAPSASLGLSDDHDGIIDLPEDAPVGTAFAAYAGLDDPVIEIGHHPEPGRLPRRSRHRPRSGRRRPRHAEAARHLEPVGHVRQPAAVSTSICPPTRPMLCPAV
ncbi:MAG: hypothetical protein ACMVO3_05265 [Thalassobaculum sp.]